MQIPDLKVGKLCLHDKTFELLNRQNMRMQRFAEANPQNPNVFRIARAAKQRSNP